MTRILMVCLGNICRSPLAEGILRSKLPKENFSVDSAGTAAYHVGDPPDKRSVAIAQKKGIGISNLRGRQFNVQDFDDFDFIYAMDKSNFEHIIKMARSEKDMAKVELILNETSPGENLDVPDPYYGGDEGFEIVFEMLDVACSKIASKLG